MLRKAYRHSICSKGHSLPLLLGFVPVSVPQWLL
jgi:hypothetical protein